MKTIIFILSLFLITSCEKNEQKNQETSDLNGTWKLTKFEAGFGPTFTYNGEITWTFNLNNTINVSIVSGTDVYDSLPLKVSGVYDFSTNGGTIHLVDMNATYDFEINNQTLRIFGDTSADGIALTFERIN